MAADLALFVEDPALHRRVPLLQVTERLGNVSAGNLDAGVTTGKIAERMSEDDDGHGA